MRHLLIGVLYSYRQYRQHVAYHGKISQTSIVGVEQSSLALYPNQSRANIYKEDSRVGGNLNEINSKKSESEIDVFCFKYRLIYNHLNMITIKEWLDKRIILQKNKRK